MYLGPALQRIMSNFDDDFDNIKALVRGLHGPIRNVSRPQTPDATNDSTMNISSDGQSSTVTTSSPQNTFLDTMNANSRNSSHHHSNISLNLNIPSLVVTEVDHPNHDQHSQRRFSQFYLGLRRFSTSATVFSKLFLSISK